MFDNELNISFSSEEIAEMFLDSLVDYMMNVILTKDENTINFMFVDDLEEDETDLLNEKIQENFRSIESIHTIEEEFYNKEIDSNEEESFEFWTENIQKKWIDKKKELSIASLFIILGIWKI